MLRLSFQQYGMRMSADIGVIMGDGMILQINDQTMDSFKVNIDKENNVISVFNNGRGIPIEIHSKEKIWIPELIFGNLLTSSNYDDDQKKMTGGRNGYGAKLANIYSTEFSEYQL